jgi:hypothetical protein
MPASFGKAAGTVRIAAQTAMKSTALTGIRLALTLLQILQPGMAPSREKA